MLVDLPWTRMWAERGAKALKLLYGLSLSMGNGAPDRIRTCDLCLRRAALYPAELRVPDASLAEYNRGFNGKGTG
jgi:hypothetical protein